MHVVCDVGNSHTVLALYQGSTRLRHFRVTTRRDFTSDEYAALWRSLLSGLPGWTPSSVTATAVATVVPSLATPLKRSLQDVLGITPLVVEHAHIPSLRIDFPHPEKVGIDRLLNAAAALQRTRRRTIVVDLGSATTFDCVSAEGVFLGGAIAPGLGCSAEALWALAPRLPRVSLQAPMTSVANNTEAALQSGIVLGYVELVDGMLRRLQTELGECALLATGGWAHAIVPHSQSITEVDEFLTLEGLRLVCKHQAHP